MIIFLYGSDTYRSRRKLNEIIEEYKRIHKSGLNLKYFNGENLNFQDFINEIKSVSMFSEKKLVILTNTAKNEKFKGCFLAELKKFISSEDAILFYEEGKIPQGNSLTKIFKKAEKSQEFQPLGGQKLKSWAKKELSGYKTDISPEALEKLVEFAGNDLWQLSNEIKKLVNYKRNKKIESADVGLLVRSNEGNDIFKTINSLALKDKKKALELIHKHLEKGDSPLYLLTMIAFQFRNLLIVKNLSQRYQSPYAISKITHSHPFLVKKCYALAKKFTIPELKKIYQKIFEVDLSIKSGKLEPETALDLLIAEV